jgi:hypothetical protein
MDRNHPSHRTVFNKPKFAHFRRDSGFLAFLNLERQYVSIASTCRISNAMAGLDSVPIRAAKPDVKKV